MYFVTGRDTHCTLLIVGFLAGCSNLVQRYNWQLPHPEILVNALRRCSWDALATVQIGKETVPVEHPLLWQAGLKSSCFLTIRSARAPRVLCGLPQPRSGSAGSDGS